MIFEVFVAAFLVMLVSLSGVVLAHKTIAHHLQARLSYFVAVSAGVFLVTASMLLIEAFELLPALYALGAAVLGYVVAWGLHLVMPETHHHHDASCAHHHRSARRLVVGDSIHNVADGITLVPAFAVSPVLGAGVLFSIVVHEVLQEISEFVVLKQAGYSNKRALGINFLVSSTILIGVAIGLIVLVSTTLEGMLLAVSAGFFVHVVIHDLWPTRSAHATTTVMFMHLAAVFVGALLMFGINQSFGHFHLHGAENHAYDDHEHYLAEDGELHVEHGEEHEKEHDEEHLHE